MSQSNEPTPSPDPSSNQGVNGNHQPADKPNQNPLIQELIKERDSLKQEVEKLREERDRYRDSLCALTRREFDSLDEEEMLALVGKQKPLREFIAELENSPEG
jgi:uncharacterized coiled-coil DUF342 family protein